MSGVTFKIYHTGDWEGRQDEQRILHSLYDLIRLLDEVRKPIILSRIEGGQLTLEIYEA